MISPERLLDSHSEGDRKRASVCSMPPSEVGVGMTASGLIDTELAVDDGDDVLCRGRK